MNRLFPQCPGYVRVPSKPRPLDGAPTVNLPDSVELMKFHWTPPEAVRLRRAALRRAKPDVRVFHHASVFAVAHQLL